MKESKPPLVVLCQTRADISIFLLRRLSATNTIARVFSTMLSVIMDTLHQSEMTFSKTANMTGPARYYRTLLRLLFLALNKHASLPSMPSELAKTPKKDKSLTTSATVSMVLVVIENIVAKGFREVAAQMHDPNMKSNPQDLALLTAILQACLRVPGIEYRHQDFINIMLAHDTPSTASNLFSWSERLAVDGDPIYGELSLLFLLELSTVPAMAEQLAIDGILGHISSADITTCLRQGRVSPFADGTGLQRCYSIWARGILPLTLNILVAVGRSIATEVALFLEQYNTLIRQAQAAFDVPGSNRMTTSKGAHGTSSKYITLTIAQEVHSLALIMEGLARCRADLSGIQEVPELSWDGGGLRENIEWWLAKQNVLAERIIPMGQRDQEMVHQKDPAPSSGNMLQSRIVTELRGIWEVLGEGVGTNSMGGA